MGDDVRFTGRRRLTIRLLALLGSATFGFMLVFVLGDAAGRVGQEHELEPAGSPEAQLGAEQPGELVHIVGAATALVVGGTSLIGLAIRPERSGSATQTGAVALAMLLTTVIVGDPDNHGGQGLLVDPAFLVMAMPPLAAAASAVPWRSWGRMAIARPNLLLLAVFALPAAWYGMGQGLMQRRTWPPLADPHHQAHWYAMSLSAFLIVLVVAGGALGGRGWRAGSFAAGLGAVALAVVSLLVPASASAVSSPWALAALVWGAAVMAMTRSETQEVSEPDVRPATGGPAVDPGGT